MSFEKMKDAELRQAAEWFGVDVSSCINEKGKVSPTLAAAAFAEDGVTLEMYAEEAARRERARAELEEAERLERQRLENVIKEQKVLEEEVEPVQDTVVLPKKRTRPEREVLVKMDRQNPFFQVAGKTFTREHPFAVMTPEEAQEIFDLEHGFHIATPREAAEYYS